MEKKEINHVLIVEDDKEIREGVEIYLRSQGYEVFQAADGIEGLAVVEKEEIHLAIVDVMMPRMDGIQMTIKLREKHDFPVIFLSAKGDIVDKSIGFKAGGDDYLVKPFDNSELLLRIEAHLRRHKGDLAFARASAQNGYTTVGDLSISFGKYLVAKNGRALDLTSKEFEILALLAANPGQVYTRQQIYEHIWGEGAVVDANSITVFIRRIREKIEDNASQPKYLLTVWGVGYKFAE